MRLIWALVVGIGLSGNDSFAQTIDSQSVNALVGLARSTIADVRDKVAPTLDEFDRSILDDIEFIVDPSISFQGAAFIKDERRKVVIYAGVPFLADVLAQSMVVGFKGNVPCMQTHLFASLKAMIEGMSMPSGNRPTVWRMQGFAKIENVCRQADTLLTGDDETVRLLADTNRIIMSLIILHEIGHHILFHVEDSISNPPTAAELRRSRRNEDEADKWAIAKAIEIGEPVILATPYLLLMMVTTPNAITLEGEKAQRHPSGPRRALLVLDALVDELRKNEASDEVIKSSEEVKKLLDGLLPN